MCSPEITSASRCNWGVGVSFFRRFLLTGEILLVRYKFAVFPKLADIFTSMPILLQLFVPVRIVFIDVAHTFDDLCAPFGKIVLFHAIFIA